MAAAIFVVLKMCARCRTPKTLEEFPKAPRMTDGRHSYCRACMNEYRREWLKANPDKRAQRRANARRRYREIKAERVTAARIGRRGRNGNTRTQRKNTIEPYLPVSCKDVVPAAPFAQYVGELFPGWTPGELAVLLAIPERRVRDLLEYGAEAVTLDLVDRALTIGLGRPDVLNALYPYEDSAA